MNYLGIDYMSLGTGCVMGLAMGTSEAVGYVDAEGNILGWFNELAFAPVDLNEHAMRDEWSGDLGVGCKYFSQDAVAKLAPAAGIALVERLTPAEKLKEVQTLAEGGNPYALAIFDSIGVYLAHTLSLYEMFYDIRNLLVLGRVASGIGGERIVSECQRVLNEEYPELSRKLRVMLPDENFRRVGQSMAAASLNATPTPAISVTGWGWSLRCGSTSAAACGSSDLHSWWSVMTRSMPSSLHSCAS